MSIQRYVVMKPEIEHTENVWGSDEDLAGKKLILLERSRDGSSYMCAFNDHQLVLVDARDVQEVKSKQVFP